MTQIQYGAYRVERWCCTSGQCTGCWQLGYGRRKRVVQLSGLSKGFAERVAENWRAYGAKVAKAQGYSMEG